MSVGQVPAAARSYAQPGPRPGPRSVALLGKGGVGKTALAALLTKALVGTHDRLLVVDADPVVGLPQVLGVKVTKTIGDVRQEVIATAQGGRGEVAPMIDYMILECLVEADGFALLAMGREEGPGCFCPVNDLLRAAIEALAASFDIILIDGEAGAEQINRRVVSQVDMPLIVTDPTVRGIQTAALLNEILRKRQRHASTGARLVVNRVRKEQQEQLTWAAQQAGLEVVGFIPEDETITQWDLAGKPLYDLGETLPSVVAVRGIAKELGFRV